MRRNTAILLLVLALKGTAQTNQNYVKTTTYLDENEANAIVSYQYYDGLGRPSQTAANGMGTDGKYVHTMTTFDQNGREERVFQPVVGGTNADYKTEALIKVLSKSTYSNDPYGYRQTEYDALDRPVSIQSAGSAWHTNNKKAVKEYGCNAANSVKHYVASTENTTSVSLGGYYKEGMLDMEKTTDEDGKTIEVYKDFLGHTILERRAGNNDTYYVYNNAGLLRFVLSPMYQQSASLTYYAYEYRYDSKGRLTWKRLPSCEYIQYWYDRNNRMAYMQDGNLRHEGKYRFYLYDAFSRQAVQGLCTAINTSSSYNASVSYVGAASGLLDTGYSMNEPFNHGTMQLEVADYYDSYEFLSDGHCGSVSPMMQKDNAASATSLPTGKIFYTSTNVKLSSVTYYDELGRVVCESRMYPIGCSKTETQYSFTNKPLKIVRSSAHGPSTHTLTYTYDYYESNDKPKKVTLKYDYQPSIDMAEYEYNSLGQLKKLKRGGMDNATYSYDIQGHLTDITNPKFTENLLYANGGLFNGNIAYSFSTSEGSVPHLYHYGYDGLNRLTSASYSNAISNDRDFYNENATYDTNGNILSLQRNGLKDDGTYGGIDNLTYSYAGNQVVRISDAVSGPNYAGAFHFIDNNDSYYEYAYDRNGNMTLDFNRKISQIEYNFLNLPKNVTMRNNAGYMSYTYDALGTKLRKAYLVYGTNGTEGGYYDYMGEFVYNGTTLEQVRFDGGYISFAANGLPQYHYYHQDHLGNIRTVTDAGGQVEQRRSYYPFGTSFKESATTDDNRLKFSGKELERLHGLNDYDFGARTYVPTIGRFTQIDPLCEKYYHVSPYAYCADNPVNAIDPDGKYIAYFNSKTRDYYVYYKGNYYYQLEDTRDKGKVILGNVVYVKPAENNLIYRSLLALRKMEKSQNSYIKAVFDDLSDLNNRARHTIQLSGDDDNKVVPIGQHSKIYLDLDLYKRKPHKDFEGIGITDFEIVGHELKHSYDIQHNKNRRGKDDRTGVEIGEYEAVNFENLIRREEGKPLRRRYADSLIPQEFWEKITLWK